MGERVDFLIVGGGKMGEAILSGWIASSAECVADVHADDVVVVNPGQQRRDHLGSAYGVRCVASVAEAPQARVVVLAVKPQVMMGVIEEIATLPAFQGGADGPLFISIAAGLTTESLLASLPEGAPLVRVMPNTPLQIGAGASGVCGGASASPAQVEYVAQLFGCLGAAVVVDESLMDAVGALSGSGPAYVAAMIEALRDAAMAHGIEGELAESLALQTVLGTARLIDETDLTPEQARIAVCSPGGTTLAALQAMAESGFDQVFQAGIDAAVARSKELAQCS